MWSARCTHCVFHVHDLFVSFGAVCGQQGIHTVFSMFMTCLSHLVLYVVGKAYTLFSMFMTCLPHLVLYVVGKAYTLCFPCS